MSLKTLAAVALVLFFGSAAAQTFEPVVDWPQLPPGRATLGNMHGDVAVSAAGDVYVSVQEPGAGIQVFSAHGYYLRAFANSPTDLHGFVIRDRGDGEHLYGASLRGEKVVKMTLAGEIVLEIPGSAIPMQFKTTNRFSEGVSLLLSGIDIAPNGDIYVVDGYSSDYVHRFDKTGRYLASFGGKAAPYGFDTLHKLAIDERYDPPRITAVDRANNRVVQMSLDGELLGVVNGDMKLPAAVTIAGDLAIVGELQGRVALLDKNGRIVATVGENTDEGIGTNQVPPERWRLGAVLAPHGVATNAEGDIFVAEFSSFGRLHKFARR